MGRELYKSIKKAWGTGSWDLSTITAWKVFKIKKKIESVLAVSLWSPRRELRSGRVTGLSRWLMFCIPAGTLRCSALAWRRPGELSSRWAACPWEAGPALWEEAEVRWGRGLTTGTGWASEGWGRPAEAATSRTTSLATGPRAVWGCEEVTEGEWWEDPGAGVACSVCTWEDCHSELLSRWHQSDLQVQSSLVIVRRLLSGSALSPTRLMSSSITTTTAGPAVKLTYGSPLTVKPEERCRRINKTCSIGTLNSSTAASNLVVLYKLQCIIYQIFRCIIFIWTFSMELLCRTLYTHLEMSE